MVVEERNHADFVLKIMKFHNIAVKIYPHKCLNISKEVVRSKELSLRITEEIKREMKKQGVMEVKRKFLKKQGKQLKQTHT